MKAKTKLGTTQGDHQPFGKHEFHSIADQRRAEEKAFKKGKERRKKRK